MILCKSAHRQHQHEIIMLEENQTLNVTNRHKSNNQPIQQTNKQSNKQTFNRGNQNTHTHNAHNNQPINKTNNQANTQSNKPSNKQRKQTHQPKKKPYIQNHATPDRPPPASAMLRSRTRNEDIEPTPEGDAIEWSHHTSKSKTSEQHIDKLTRGRSCKKRVCSKANTHVLCCLCWMQSLIDCLWCACVCVCVFFRVLQKEFYWTFNLYMQTRLLAPFYKFADRQHAQHAHFRHIWGQACYKTQGVDFFRNLWILGLWGWMEVNN